MSFYIHNIDPIAFQVFGVSFPWYWLVYFFGYFWVYWAITHFHKINLLRAPIEDFFNFLFYGFFILLLSGKIFYILFYNLDYYLHRPERMLYLWQGGMSFHGALIGCGLWTFLYARKKKVDMWAFADPVITATPLVLFFGRIANFINGELAGRVTDVSWAVIFPKLYDMNPRHPSQIYEALFEGLVLFAILWWKKKNILRPSMQTIFFIFGYGFFRFFIEYFRMPDKQIGLIFNLISIGQIYCLLMMFFAGALYFYRRKKV